MWRRRVTVPPKAPAADAARQAQSLMEVRDVGKVFRQGSGLLARWTEPVVALKDVSLPVREGRTLAIVGESGSGKTTLGRCMVGIHDACSGSITYKGETLSVRRFARDIELRRQIQMIFQDPASSLNPRHRVRRILAEPMIVAGLASPDEVEDRIGRLLHSVGLPPDASKRLPHEFSGGQKQRIAIARALSLEPEMLVCDEAVSALDVSVQAQIINLLKDLQQERSLTYVFISHDMAVVRHIADDVGVMRSGELVEFGGAEKIFAHPATDYTRELLAAVPRGIARWRKHAR